MYEKGVYISGVKEESLAEKAGLSQFDRILQVMLLITASS
jgi:C-terminal processing protease CtpA/Prc